MTTEIRTGKTPPQRVRYNFGRLEKKGQSFFLAGTDAHRVRQAAISYMKHHPEVSEAGDKLHIFKETEDGVEGIGVYRLAITNSYRINRSRRRSTKEMDNVKLEILKRGENNLDGTTQIYGINAGSHPNAVVCHLSGGMADLIVASANSFIIGAKSLKTSPLELAEKIGENLADIGKALVWGRKGLQVVREVVEDAGYTWPPHTWDSEDGIPGHALELISGALDCFPAIEFMQPVDEQVSVLKEMRDFLANMDDTDETAKDLIERANGLIAED